MIDLARTSGDDAIYGFDIVNTHDGGAGDDRLEGMGGSDTYVFARGYGLDEIIERNDGIREGAGHDRVPDLALLAAAGSRLRRFEANPR